MDLARRSILLFVVSLLAAGCGPEAPDPDEEYGMDGPLQATPPPGKEDGLLRRGLPVDTDTRRTQVWTARNRWEDTDTPAARRAGMAWPADSGLTWDEKYARWIDSMERVNGEGGEATFRLTTPWGKTLDSPSLECAELSIFLRISFAAWYELPFFMEAVDGRGARVYFGHNGVRTAAGRYASTPEYALRYRDVSDRPPAAGEPWPRDEGLRALRLAGGEDEQTMVAEGATFGAYVDEVHLNKRAGHFILLALNYLGSINLADSANTYNVVADAVRPGDFLVHRWQRSGIGHTLVVKQVTTIGESNLDAALVSGSMPRRQGRWESGVASRQYFTDDHAGGEGVNVEGVPYAALGGGLKRWRVTKSVGGVWSNTWMAADEASWIDSRDLPRLAARPARFAGLLGQIAPEDARAGLLAVIDDARAHLAEYPASCAARERRERAFDELYDLMAREFGTGRDEVDALYRDDEDLVFAPLVYTRSRTCCWDSTTAAMHDIVVDFAAREREAAEEAGECWRPTVFMSQGDGYERWRAFAAGTGRAPRWRAWSEDESCPQRAVASDTVDPSAPEVCE